MNNIYVGAPELAAAISNVEQKRVLYNRLSEDMEFVAESIPQTELEQVLPGNMSAHAFAPISRAELKYLEDARRHSGRNPVLTGSRETARRCRNSGSCSTPACNC